MKLKLLVFFLSCVAFAFAFANDLEVINNLHGGLAKKTDSAIIEFVQSGEKANVYITGHDKKNLANQKLSITAIANIKGKEFPMNLSYENDHYSLTPYEKLKYEKNFVVSFTISFPLPGKVEKTSFTVGK
jgi:hypothetical protein